MVVSVIETNSRNYYLFKIHLDSNLENCHYDNSTKLPSFHYRTYHKLDVKVRSILHEVVILELLKIVELVKLIIIWKQIS